MTTNLRPLESDSTLLKTIFAHHENWDFLKPILVRWQYANRPDVPESKKQREGDYEPYPGSFDDVTYARDAGLITFAQYMEVVEALQPEKATGG